jgi:hypothetical protein
VLSPDRGKHDNEVVMVLVFIISPSHTRGMLIMRRPFAGRGFVEVKVKVNGDWVWMKLLLAEILHDAKLAGENVILVE